MVSGFMALEWNAAAPTILDASKSPITAPTTGFSAYPFDATAGATQQRVFPSVHAIGVSHFSKKQKAAFAYEKAGHKDEADRVAKQLHEKYPDYAGG